MISRGLLRGALAPASSSSCLGAKNCTNIIILNVKNMLHFEHFWKCTPEAYPGHPPFQIYPTGDWVICLFSWNDFLVIKYFITVLSQSNFGQTDLKVSLPSAKDSSTVCSLTILHGMKAMCNCISGTAVFTARRHAERGICNACSVRLSHVCIVWKRLNVSSKFFHHLIGPSF